jgi:hypothetical protein
MKPMSQAEESELMTNPGQECETHIQVVQSAGLAEISRSEIESQLDAAHKYPRKISTFMRESIDMISRSIEVASSCFYTLPPRRGGDGKSISGPSVRLAEIAASAYRNLHIGARPIDVGDTEVTSQGVVWDVQNNVRISVEKKRRITTKTGMRFSEDGIVTTQNAATSIALRDAIFRIIPRAYIHELEQHARKVAVGDAKTLADRRSKAFLHFAQMGATQDRVLAALGKSGIEDVGLDDLEKLIGFSSAIKDGQASVDECFPLVKAKESAPSPTQSEEGRRMRLGGELNKKSIVTIDDSATKAVQG